MRPALLQPQQSERRAYLAQMKVRIHQQLVERLDVQNLKTLPPDTVRGEVRMLIRDLCQSEKGLLNAAEQEAEQTTSSTEADDADDSATTTTESTSTTEDETTTEAPTTTTRRPASRRPDG